MCAINTAAELLEMMYLGCYTVDLVDGMLEVSPAFAIDEEMANLIKRHKTELIGLLNKSVPNEKVKVYCMEKY